MSEEYIELKIKKSIAEKICFVFKLFILILIPYLILAIPFNWGEWPWAWLHDLDWLISPRFGEIQRVFFMSLCSIVYIRLLYSNKIIRKVYLLIPLFLTFLSAPTIIILRFEILIEPQYHGDLLRLCIDAATDFIVSSICSVLYVRHLKTKTAIHNTDNP